MSNLKKQTKYVFHEQKSMKFAFSYIFFFFCHKYFRFIPFQTTTNIFGLFFIPLISLNPGQPLNAPSGGILWDVMFVPSLLLSQSLQFFLPMFPLCFISISLTLSIRFHFQLFHRYTSLVSASICSVLATFTPYLLGYPLSSGVYERLSIWFFP